MSTQDNIRIQSRKDPAQLEREIDQQRNHIAELVDALGSRLSPGQLFERVLSSGKDGGSEFVGNLGHTVKAHPVPALLAATGLAWLYASSRQETVATTTATTDVGGVQQGHLGERMQHVRKGASDKIHDARRTAHDAADAARERAHRANEGFHHMLQDNPMALGAMGVAAGAMLGAMLPITRKEHELMGEASDRLTREARQTARGGIDTAREAAREVTGSTSGDRGQPHTPSSRAEMGTGRTGQQPPTS